MSAFSRSGLLPLLLGLFSSALAAPQVPAPVAGTYVCTIWFREYSSYGGMATVFRPSRLGSVVLDGRGTYRLTSTQGGSGKYSFSSTRTAFAFVNGPLATSGVRYEYVDDGFKERRFTLQLLDKKTGEEERTSCDLRDKTTGQPLSNVPGSAASSPQTGSPPARAGNPNPGLRGTLTFAYNNSIQSLDLVTGKKLNQLGGAEIGQSKSGQFLYLNPQDELAFADNKYQPKGLLTRPGESGDLSQPAVSADGQRVAYHLNNYPAWVGVIVRSRSGQQLAAYEWKRSPSWGPDGRLVMAEDTGWQGHRPGLFVVTADLKTFKTLPVNLDDLTQPAVSPDGQKVAFISNGDLWTVNMDGSGLKRRLNTPDTTESEPVWSPDSRALVFGGDRGELFALGSNDQAARPVRDAAGNSVYAASRVTWR